jgi:hypothetical protein
LTHRDDEKDRIDYKKKNVGILNGKKIIIGQRERKARKTGHKS